MQESSKARLQICEGKIALFKMIIILTIFKEQKCEKVPYQKCEDAYLDKCKETPKKVGQKVTKHRCVWPKRTITDDLSC